MQNKPRGYEPGRLRRAALLACKKLGLHQYRIRGQHQPYYDVDLTVDPACYCLDSQYHSNTMCKHEIRGRLAEGDPRLMQALGDILFAQQKRLDEAHKRRKRRTPSKESDTR